MKNTFFGIAAATASLVVAVACTASLRAEDAPGQIDLSKFPASAVDDVVVPVPSEIFIVLDKLGTPNWKNELRPDLGKNTGVRAQTALLLGTVIAEGFIAVEAEDSERVKQIGREVLTLSDAIGVRSAVVARSKAIIEKADDHDWNGTRQELDGALQDVRGAMDELQSQDLAQLVSLGGWVRGTEVLTSIVQKDYRKDRAELLHQPELLNYFNNRLDEMGPRLRKNDLVSQLKDMLKEIRPLILENGGRKITPESVQRIHDVTNRMVVNITASDA
ncbi:MAG: hypothetical protein ACREKL_06955 [Chthoniobacterales bacterium]